MTSYLTANSIRTAAVVGGGTIEDTISLRLRPTGGVRNIDLGADHNLTISGEIFGPQGISKQGDGKLTLSAANTYETSTTVISGILEVLTDSALGTAAGGTVVESGATLRLNSGANIASEALTLSGTLDGRTNGGDVEYGGAITLAANAEFFAGGSGTFTVSGTVDGAGNQLTLNHGSPALDITGLISGTGTQVVKTGSGTATLTAANTFNGGLQIGETNQAGNAGTVSIEHNTALGSGQLSYGSGGTLDLGVSGLTIGNNVFVGNRNDNSDYKIRLDLAGNATGELTNNIEIRKGTAKAFVAEVGDGDTLTFSGSTTTGDGGGAGITKTGAGTLRLTNANNSFSGKFYVDGGELQIAESGTINDQTIEVASGAAFRWSSSAARWRCLTHTYDGGMSGDGTFIKDGSNSNLIVRNFSGASIANMEVHQGTLSGAGNQWRSRWSNYHQLYWRGSVEPTTPPMSWIGGSSGTVTERAASLSSGRSTGTKTYAKGNSNDITDNTDITLNGDLTVNSASTGTFTLGGVISGSGGLTKTNTGTLELSGNNTFGGNTNVNSGTLALSSANNNIANSTAIDVASGATLDVSGITNGFALANGQTLSGAGSVVGGTTVGTGAILSPGNSPGTQTFDNLTWINGGTYLWEINADTANGGGEGADPGWDWIDVTNTFDLSGITTGFNIDITSLTGANDAGLADGFDNTGKSYLDPYESFTILSFTSLTGTFDASEFNLLTGNFANPKVGWNIDLVGTDLVLNAVFVPEPSSAALLGLGGLALMLRRKRSAA